jgi:hypothetical protein
MEPVAGQAGWYKCSITTTVIATAAAQTTMYIAGLPPAGSTMFVFRADLTRGSTIPKELQYTAGTAVADKNFTPSGGFVMSTRNIDSYVDTPVLPTAEAGVDLGGGNELRSNYITMNPLDKTTGMNVLEGALVGYSGAAIWQTSRTTRFVSSGKWYWETQASNMLADYYTSFGIMGPGTTLVGGSNIYVGLTGDSYGYLSNAYKYNNGVAVAYGAAYGSEDFVGIALDMDAKTLTFYKNGVSQGIAYSGFSGSFAPAVSVYSGAYAFFNAGQRRLAYPAPSGFKLLHAANP